MKICTRCKSEKDITEFAKRNDRKGGYRSICKSCDAAYSRAYRKENAAKHKISYTNWRIKNADRYLSNKRNHEKIRRDTDPVYRETRRVRNGAYAKTPAGKACQRKWIRKGYDIGDDVLYMKEKYKILEIIPYKGCKIRKYGPENKIMVIGKKHLEKKKIGL